MLRLVTQFDDSHKNVSISTPTCGGCCCCCCCLATTISASLLTSLNLRNIAEKRSDHKKQGNKLISLGKISLPIAIAIPLLIMYLLPLEFQRPESFFPVLTITIWTTILILAYRSAGLSDIGALRISLITVILGAVAFAAEAAGGAFIIFLPLLSGDHTLNSMNGEMNTGLILYLIAATIATVVTYRIFVSRHKSAGNSTDAG